MSRKIAIGLVKIYRVLFSFRISKYAIEVIEKHGVVKGAVLTASRILSCHPLTKRPIYDPA
jgi:putative component of membrane protein insertase Oxa1/YidC/SpoIIIJ protein YidD